MTILVYLISSILFINSIKVTFAATPTVSPSPEPSPVVTKTPNLDEIQKIREAIQQKVKEKLKQITTPSDKPKAIIGTITKIQDSEITIDYKSTQKIVLTDEETVFIDAKRNKTTIGKIKPGQEILAMGYNDESNNLSAKRVVLVDLKIIENKSQTIIGKIVDISQSSPLFTLIPSKDKNIQYQIKTDQKTEIFGINNNKIELKNVTPGNKLIIIVKPDEKISKTFYATKIINMSQESSPAADKNN